MLRISISIISGIKSKINPEKPNRQNLKNFTTRSPSLTYNFMMDNTRFREDFEFSFDGNVKEILESLENNQSIEERVDEQNR